MTITEKMAEYLHVDEAVFHPSEQTPQAKIAELEAALDALLKGETDEQG